MNIIKIIGLVQLEDGRTYLAIEVEKRGERQAVHLPCREPVKP